MDETSAKKVLQAEVVKVKTRWPDEVKLSKAKPDVPTYPLPIAVQRMVPRPDFASAYDVEEIGVKLWVDSLDGSSLPVRVEISAVMPQMLKDRIASHIRERWVTELGARGASGAWFLEKILGWVEGAFEQLLNLEPTLVETYEGVDDNGMTIRRFAIAEPPPPPPEPEEKEEDDNESEEDSEEEVSKPMSKLSVEQERQLRIAEKALIEAERLEAAEKRAEAEKYGADYGRTVPVSKKEQQRLLEEKRQKSGSRLKKTGSKANKFDAEAAGKKANKKNGLMH